MASYDATIRLLADISPADKALDRLQSKIQAIKKASTIVIRGPSDASPGVKKQIEGYSTLISLLERYKKGLREVPTLTKESIFQDPGKGPIGDAFRKAKKEVADLSIALANAGDNFKEVFQTQRESLGIGKDVRNYANQLEFAASILGRIREGFKDNTAEAKNLEAAIRNIVNELQSVRPGSGLTTEIQSAVGPRTQAGLSGPFGISAEQINAALEQKAEQFVRLQQKQINNLSQINRLRKAGLNVNQADTLVSAAGEQLRKGNVTEAAKLVKEAEEELRILSRVNGILRRNRNERRRERIQQGRSRQRRASASPGRIAVGAAFPALFGGGPGAILGGGIGEAFGPLGGVVGSALGQQLDTFVVKITQLGQALNTATADVDTIVTSLGAVGTPTAVLISRLEEVAGKQVALEAATAQLALVVGNDGVNALQSFGEATTELNNAITKLVTQILAEVARLLDAPTRAAAGVVEEFTLQQQGLRSSDPRQVLLRTQLSNAAGPQQSQEILQQIIQLQKQINTEAEKELENRVNALSPTKDLLASEERRNAIARLNNDILNDEVLNLEKANVAAEYRIENEKILKDLTEKKLTYQEATNKFKANELAYDTALLSIMKKRVDAEEQRNKKIRETAERAAKEAARAQEQRTKQLETATVNAYKSENALLDVRLATLEFEKGAVAAAKQKLTNIALERDNAIAILEIQYKEVAAKAKSNDEALTLYTTYLNQRAVLKEQADLEYDRTQEKIKQLQAAERLAAIERRTGVGFGALLSESGMFAEDPLLGRAESPLAFGTGAQMQGLINQELALERIIEKYTEIGEAARLASELVTFGIRDMVSGTRSAEEVFAEFLQNIADMLLRTAATMIAQYIALGIARAFALGQTARVGPEMFNLNNTSFFGNAPALGGLGFGGLRANGGPVSAGQSYIVGERGPELFVPSRSGSIVPNDRLGGGDNVSVVVNVDAKGTSVQGNDQEGNQLGRVLSAAVQAELIKQKRPGGLLA